MATKKKYDRPYTNAARLRNLRRERFCRAFMRCGNPQEAARTAGYSPSYGGSLLRQEKTQDRLAQLLAEEDIANDKEIADAKEVLHFLTGVMRGEIKVSGEQIVAAKALGKRFGIEREIRKMIGARKAWFNI